MGTLPNPTDNMTNPRVTLHLGDINVTPTQAVEIHEAIRRIIGTEAVAPAAADNVTPIRVAVTDRSKEYQVEFHRDGWEPGSRTRRLYSTIEGARRRVELVGSRYHITWADISEREVGPWEPYDGAPTALTQYELSILGEGWTKPKLVIGGHRKLEALLQRNASNPSVVVTVRQRQILSGWTVVESPIKAVA